ncbi:hypothetical protein GWI33_022065 [Rhynchophorus ferrugineus]|uniref:Uncharacterized protein n=1 Tax=Rhynchophorus ferrugineus TaxID=354439 RepID=A0A834MHW0_RHYFE|nr:hypothetical protein GWI33_022065 [Rhynchophorus ferrugineus]
MMVTITHSHYTTYGNDMKTSDSLERYTRSIDYYQSSPNLIQSSIELVKHAPYVELLKLIEVFMQIKADLISRFWALLYDNTHILTALRDTLIRKVASMHNLTLSVVVAVRKILEFVKALLYGSYT